MPVYHTNSFWNYISNEAETVINKCKGLLTKEWYDFELDEHRQGNFYQEVSKLTIEGVNYVTIRFPAGLTKYLNSKITLAQEFSEKPQEYTEETVLEYANIVKQCNPSFEIRDYQIRAVLASLNNFQSLILSSVGSGKTSVMCLLCKILENDRILIMNDNNFILDQIYERLLSFDITDVSWNPGKEPDYTKRIVLLNTSSSDSRLNRQDPAYLSFLKTVNCYITDEAQGIQALTWFEPIFYMDLNNLKRLVGYSGSPFRNYKHPYNDFQDFITISILGEPAFTYEMKDTIADGNIAQPYSYFIRYNNRPANIPEQFKDSYFIQYKMNITYNKARNDAGLAMLKFLNQNRIKTLVSFNNLKPAQKMMRSLVEAGIKAMFICGDNTIYEWIANKRGTLKLEERKGTPKDIKAALENGYNIIFGSVVMDRGVDIEAFQAAVLFSAGKTPIANIQRIGRASRKRKTGRNISFIIDFRDINGNATFQSHYEQRKQMMKDSGVINIEKVQDFCAMIEELSEENKKL